GSRFLDRGEVPAAWAYFRAIGEPGPVASALEQYEPDEDADKLGQVVDVAFNQGANPRRGFELILDHYGTCAAITALEQSPPADPAVQVACIERLIRHLHEQLVVNIRADIQQRGESPGESSSISSLIAGRDWLFADEGYHTDISHLSSTVRYSILVTDPAVLALAAELADYGKRLSPRLQFEGTPPFERTFDDHLVYLRALLGHDQDLAIAHFQQKLGTDLEGDPESSYPAQVLVNLLARTGRLDRAIDLAIARLAHLPDGSMACPGIAELCARAGRLDRLASIARQQENLVHFLAARLQEPAASI
ncbi:MAG: tetratricopeptide repeat protein, partial [Isosphaeraceae bacterium]